MQKKHRKNTLAGALAAGLAISAFIVPAAEAATSPAVNGFTVQLNEIDDSGKRYLEWGHDGCTGSLGESPEITYTLTKGDTPVPINGKNRIELADSDDATFTLTGVCKPSRWLGSSSWQHTSVSLAVQPGKQAPSHHNQAVPKKKITRLPKKPMGHLPYTSIKKMKA
ncbi:hypothetical protein JTE88_07475 [Arcanobacterium phocisimile]|uniref:Uncharacterized protein n=1 Tax=Arcanobacterium phocisimile TaxID=1302235 RepID=A0ABX7IFK2_9ACTO|nr:hypothetical protein [Arcanobacterium phocisimile]QRV01911.1 hypothetical protein JTE88_07475 [Arcanobacterium phocisimile]